MQEPGSSEQKRGSPGTQGQTQDPSQETQPISTINYTAVTVERWGCIERLVGVGGNATLRRVVQPRLKQTGDKCLCSLVLSGSSEILKQGVKAPAHM